MNNKSSSKASKNITYPEMLVLAEKQGNKNLLIDFLSEKRKMTDVAVQLGLLKELQEYENQIKLYMYQEEDIDSQAFVNLVSDFKMYIVNKICGLD